jgi:uncharacterized membrane protein YcfT
MKSGIYPLNDSAILPDVFPADAKERIGWVDFAKGICMIGVVTLYAVNKMEATGGGSGWLKVWADFARPFRMPDFFLLSGLFLHRVIDRPWKDYLDKKVTHYLYFFVLWSLIFHATEWGAFRAGLVQGQGDATPLWYKLIEPFAMLWFIQLLPVFFVITRILKRVPMWVLLPIAAALQMFPPETAHPTILRNFCDRFVFFYIGYRFAPHFFRLAAWAQTRRGLALLGLIAWAVLNETLVHMGVSATRGVSLGLGLAGAMGVITAGALLMPVRQAAWLRYLGRNSLIIYLGFYLPMFLALTFFRRAPLGLDQGTIGALASGISALSALCLFWLTRGTWLKFLFARPTWAKRAAKSEPAIAGSLETGPS